MRGVTAYLYSERSDLIEMGKLIIEKITIAPTLSIRRDEF